MFRTFLLSLRWRISNAGMILLCRSIVLMAGIEKNVRQKSRCLIYYLLLENSITVTKTVKRLSKKKNTRALSKGYQSSSDY